MWAWVVWVYTSQASAPKTRRKGGLGPLEGLQHQPGPLIRVPRLGAVAVVMLNPAAPGGLGVIRDGLLRLPEGTVKSRLRTARIQLRDTLKGACFA